uniref:C-type lectin domain-containing protein n=1 Tax=Panagrellus redivivus TaxID=6233 RepID=A0A7E4UNL1_PANRE
MTTTMITMVVLATAVLALASADPCGDSSWRYSPHTGKCYKLFNEKIGWTLASFKCAFQGAQQYSIRDANENQFVSELARRVGVVWLGMAQFGTNQKYIWSDGSNWNYENWHAQHGYRKPNFNKGRKCVKLDAVTQTWMQSCCKIPSAYICARPASGSATGYQPPAVPVTTTQAAPTVSTTPWWENPKYTTTASTTTTAAPATTTVAWWLTTTTEAAPTETTTPWWENPKYATPQTTTTEAPATTTLPWWLTTTTTVAPEDNTTPWWQRTPETANTLEARRRLRFARFHRV